MSTASPLLREESPRQRRSDRARLGRAIDASRRYLAGRQSGEGFWNAELIGDATLESDAVMLMHFLGRVDEAKQRRLLEYVLSQQNPDGGWPIYSGGPGDPNATVKAYFALRLAGHAPEDPRVESARRRILEFGGIEACNSYTKFYLAIFGQYDWNKLPAMLAQIQLLPKLPWCFNLYRISAWTRTIVVPMLILFGIQPRVKIPFSLRDLLIPYRAPRPASWRKALWQGAFRAVDRALHMFDRFGLRPFRSFAISQARKWMLQRLAPPGGLGAIYPPMLNTIMALKALGYGLDSPQLSKALREFEALEVREGDVIRMQPCFSVIWDTAWAVNALARGGAEPEAVRRGADWLLSKEIFTGGDWERNNPGVEPAAWAFEFDNPVYPDTDDTAAVLMALHRAGRDREPGFGKAVTWLLSMQNPDGGWGAFDRNNSMEILNNLPWADHNALLDPSTADLTGRILEFFGNMGCSTTNPAVRKAIQFLQRTQEADGSWFGRWGVNYIYGTWQVLVGLRAAGQDMGEPWVRKAVEWLRGVQNPDGGWGETCRSYDDPRFKGVGPSTASQTAWALLGLIAGGVPPSDASILGGMEYLLRTQRADGGWNEAAHVGTGFPRVFYLVYTMYCQYFPLLALQAVNECANPGR